MKRRCQCCPGSEFVPCVFAAQRKKTSVASLDPEGLNVEVGDQVLVAGQKHGIVRFYGKTDFAPGLFPLLVRQHVSDPP